MRRHIYDHTGTHVLRIEEAEPVCGEDFCDRCGDCLVCYEEGDCREQGNLVNLALHGGHFWVVYEETTP